jgi:hypothetical protein
MAAVGGTVLFIIVLAVGFVVYFLPAIVGRKKRNANAITALNLLLGWTILGWIITLIWALTSDPPAPSIQLLSPILCTGCGRYSEPGSQFCISCGGRLIARANGA